MNARDVLAELVAKIDECEPHLRDLHLMEQNRGRPYTGPNFATELANARAVLNEEPRPMPDGWKLVPIEPTEQMLWDGHHKIDFDRSGQNTLEMEHESHREVRDKAGNVVLGIAAGTTIKEDMRHAWAAMLAAAPDDAAGTTS